MADELAGVEYTGLENDRRTSRGVEYAGLENGPLENDGLEIGGLENDEQECRITSIRSHIMLPRIYSANNLIIAVD